MVYKPFGAASMLDGDQVKKIYANHITIDQLDDALALTANQFQEWIPKQHDVRLTAVGDQCFSAIVHAGSDAAHVDWRSDYPSLSYEPIPTPEPIAAGVVAYLHGFGLAFGAFDFVVTPDGDWWFLECNPNGQWGWIEHETGLPIASAIADLLTRRTTT